MIRQTHLPKNYPEELSRKSCEGNIYVASLCRGAVERVTLYTRQWRVPRHPLATLVTRSSVLSPSSLVSIPGRCLACVAAELTAIEGQRIQHPSRQPCYSLGKFVTVTVRYSRSFYIFYYIFMTSRRLLYALTQPCMAQNRCNPRWTR